MDSILESKQTRELWHNRDILKNAEKIWGRSGRIGEARIKRRSEMIIGRCDIDASKKVLEIGCGTGTLTEYLARTGSLITATDLDENFLNIARKQIQFSNVRFQTADAEKLENFPDDSFDAVCGVSILHHLNINSALKNIWRVLKPGGTMAFSEPNMLNPHIAIQKNIPFVKKMSGDSPDETAFFQWRMKTSLVKNNFNDISVEPFDFLHPAFPDFLFAPISLFAGILEKITFIKEIAGSLFIFGRK